MSDRGALLSLAFREALGPPTPAPKPAGLLGLEHEYRLLRVGQQVDFRAVVHSLPVPGRRLDPGDLNAYRLRSGLALTCDDAEAEIASPPIAVERGFAAAIDDWANEGFGQLRGLVPPDIAIEGYSTHLSASMPGEFGQEVARLFAITFAPVFMLLFDTAGGRGVYVRPRPGRLEVCGDYVEGHSLRAAAVFFAGAARACAAGLDGDSRAAALLPPALAVNLRPSTSRYGIYAGRRSAFGFDLYEAGPNASIPLAGGGSTTVRTQLQDAWRASREAIQADCTRSDIELVDRIVRGELPLAIESTARPAARPGNRAAPLTSGYGAILDLPRPNGLTAEAVAATWDFTVVRIASGRRRVFACIPRTSLAGFIESWREGRLDAVVHADLEQGSSARRLADPEDAREAGLWDEVEPSRLLPREQAPDGSFTSAAKKKPPARAGKAARPWKFFAPAFRSIPPAWPIPPPAPSRAEPGPVPAPPVPPEPQPQRPGPRPWWPIAAVGALIAGLILGAAVATGSGPFGNATAPEATGTPAPSPTPTATSTRTPTSTTTVVVTETALPSLTPTAVAAPAVFTATPRPPTATTVSEPPTSTPVIDPTRTPTPPCAQPGAVCTPTPTSTEPPTLTPTPTRPIDPTLTRTPTSTPCGGQGAVCTPTPTKAPNALP